MPYSLGEDLRGVEADWLPDAPRDRSDEAAPEAVAEPRYERIEERRSGAADSAARVAAWLEAHQEEFIECERHNGRARMTARACAERYRRAVGGWVDSLPLNPDKRHLLALSFATCASCPVGAYNARIYRVHLQLARPPAAAHRPPRRRRRTATSAAAAEGAR